MNFFFFYLLQGADAKLRRTKFAFDSVSVPNHKPLRLIVHTNALIVKHPRE